MWLFKKKELKKVNVRKAVATVEMKEGMPRFITRIGKTIGYRDYYWDGVDEIINYLNSDSNLLQDDNGKWFPINSIKEITVKVEDYFVDG